MLIFNYMLSRKNRIPTQEFPEVTRGKIKQNDLFKIVIKYDKKLKNPQCAVIVSHKITKTAVSRNKIRRQTYTALQKLLPKLPIAFISLFPKKSSMKQQEIQESIKELVI